DVDPASGPVVISHVILALLCRSDPGADRHRVSSGDCGPCGAIQISHCTEARMTVLLETRNVSKCYGVFQALDQVSMAVHEGEFVSVVGPNGAGKTTLVNLLTGLLEPTAGEVLFMGRTIAGVGPVALADHGLARAFPVIQTF